MLSAPDPSRAISAARAAYSASAAACRSGAKRGKKGVVYVITSDKVIQSVLTGSVVGAITASFEGTADLLSRVLLSVSGLYVPTKWLLAPMLLLLFYAALWADNNTERFREMVEEATGEEAADDSVDGDG